MKKIPKLKQIKKNKQIQNRTVFNAMVQEYNKEELEKLKKETSR